VRGSRSGGGSNDKKTSAAPVERGQENRHSLGMDHPKKPRRSSTKDNSNSNTDIYPDEEDNSIISKSNSGSDGNIDGNGNDNKYKTRN